MSSRPACVSTAPTWGSATTTAGARSSRSATRGPTRNSSATTTPHTDDTLAEMPKSYEGDVPVLDYVTHDASPLDLKTIEVFRGDTSLVMGYGKTPLSAVQRQPQRDRDVRTGRLDALRRGQGMPRRRRVPVRTPIGECLPGFWDSPLICDLATAEPCFATAEVHAELERLLCRHDQLAVRRQPRAACALPSCRTSSSRCSARMTWPASTRCCCSARTSSAIRWRAPCASSRGPTRATTTARATTG